MTLLAVPNISEGRDLDVVARIAGDVALLDVHSDPDHNRSVLSYGGAPDVVADAVLAMIDRAVASLDVRTHQGVHPRFGVVDVLPLVPYGVAEDVAGNVAAELAWKIAQGPGIPVETYDESTLPVVRKGLRGRTGHPSAGFICIGVRPPLIAFNVNVRDGLEAVRRAAAEMRELPGVRALAFQLRSRGLVQLSMNLTDLEGAGPRDAFARAASLLDVIEAEVVGLVPAWTLPQFEGLPLLREPRSIETALGG